MPDMHEHWFIGQLRRLAKTDPQTFDNLTEFLRKERPEVHTKLALMAVEHGDLTPGDCACVICSDLAAVDMHLQVYRQSMADNDRESLVELDEYGVARLSSIGIAVWEVVRESRRQGSQEALKASFPSLTTNELRAAMSYAERHPQAIDDQIDAYEAKRQRTKAAYPFA